MYEDKILKKALKFAKSPADHFKHNLNAIMKEKKINRVELAKKMNIPYTTLCDWCTGRIYPKPEKIALVAEALNVEVKDLDGIRWLQDQDDDISNEWAEVTIANKIPKDMTPREACKAYPWFDTSLSPALLRNESYFFGLRVTDDSLIPKVYEDDWVIFEQVDYIDRDGMYCIRENGKDAVIRYVIKLEDGFATMILNSPHGIITKTYSYDDVDKKVQILGRGIQMSITPGMGKQLMNNE